MAHPARRVGIAALIGLLVVVTGCSDRVAGNGAPAETDEGPATEEDCEEGETLHPISEKCVAGDGEADDGTDDGETGGDDETPEPPEECGPGGINGQACRPDGELLSSAEVTVEGVDCDGEPFSETTTTDDQGFWDFDGIPAGDHELIIESGSFETRRDVTVQPDQVTDLESEAAKVCLQDSAIEIAVVEGTYDEVGEILDDLEIDYDVVGGDWSSRGNEGVDNAAAFLDDLEAMKEYDIVFVECGQLWTEFESDGVDTDSVTATIRNYVEEGNSIYASDHAHPFIQLALPDAIDFYEENATEPDASWEGDSYSNDSPLQTRVVSDEMSTLLDADTLELELLFAWAVAEDVGPDSTVHFESDADIALSEETVEDAPMMVTYDDPGTVGGKAIFTSFHNAEQTDDQIQKIMEYMIFQL